MKAAQDAVNELNSLGFNYKLVEEGSASGGTRRTGIRKQVQDTIANGNGMTRAQIDATISADDKSAKQSVSNALSALKKAGAITQDGSGLYKSA